MTALAQDVSKLTDRYQTTVPSGVRKQLKLGKGDPALGAFLDFMEADIKAHPERLRAFDGALHDRLKTLVGDVDVDLDEALSPDDE
jgi:antitoxin PrlF